MHDSRICCTLRGEIGGSCSLREPLSSRICGCFRLVFNGPSDSETPQSERTSYLTRVDRAWDRVPLHRHVSHFVNRIAGFTPSKNVPQQPCSSTSGPNTRVAAGLTLLYTLGLPPRAGITVIILAFGGAVKLTAGIQRPCQNPNDFLNKISHESAGTPIMAATKRRTRARNCPGSVFDPQLKFISPGRSVPDSA